MIYLLSTQRTAKTESLVSSAGCVTDTTQRGSTTQGRWANSMKQSDFDLDFSNGKQGEDLVEALLTNGKTVEVKRDLKWQDTGNLYIEYTCYYQRSQSWEWSGIMVTKADYWAFVLGSGVLLVPTEVLKTVCKASKRVAETRIPPNPSKGYLITVQELVDALRKEEM